MMSIMIRRTMKNAVEMPCFVILKIQKDTNGSPGV